MATFFNMLKEIRGTIDFDNTTNSYKDGMWYKITQMYKQIGGSNETSDGTVDGLLFDTKAAMSAAGVSATTASEKEVLVNATETRIGVVEGNVNTSKEAAANSATASQASSYLSSEWATKITGPVEGTEGVDARYSSKYHANVSAVKEGLMSDHYVAMEVINDIHSADSTTLPNVATNKANITTVAGVIGAVSAVGGISTQVSTVASIAANITTVADINASVTAVASNASDISTASNIAGNITTVAGISSDVSTTASNSANITAVASNASNINTTAASAANITAVAGSITSNDLPNVAGSLTEIGRLGTVATIDDLNILGTVGTVADMGTLTADPTTITNIGTVADNIDDVITAATAAAVSNANVEKAGAWAIKMDGPVEGAVVDGDAEYSSKYNAGIASEWATKDTGTIGSTGLYSARQYATNADASDTAVSAKIDTFEEAGGSLELAQTAATSATASAVSATGSQTMAERWSQTDNASGDVMSLDGGTVLGKSAKYYSEIAPSEFGDLSDTTAPTDGDSSKLVQVDPSATAGENDLIYVTVDKSFVGLSNVGNYVAVEANGVEYTSLKAEVNDKLAPLSIDAVNDVIQATKAFRMNLPTAQTAPGYVVNDYELASYGLVKNMFAAETIGTY